MVLLVLLKGPVWQDKRCHRSANAAPSQAAITARKPASVTVYVLDESSCNLISGKVFINNVVVGNTDRPFAYTFNSPMSETVKVPSYPDATVNFGVINTLSVSATPNTIELGKPVQNTIYAMIL